MFIKRLMGDGGVHNPKCISLTYGWCKGMLHVFHHGFLIMDCLHHYMHMYLAFINKNNAQLLLLLFYTGICSQGLWIRFHAFYILPVCHANIPVIHNSSCVTIGNNIQCKSDVFWQCKIEGGENRLRAGHINFWKTSGHQLPNSHEYKFDLWPIQVPITLTCFC